VNKIIAGDLLRIRPGGRIPVDGIIVSGRAAVDESAITGESLPVERGPGSRLAAGTLLTDASIVMRATQVGANTTLARIVAMVERAQGSKPSIARLADRISEVFVPAILLIAVATFVGWYLLGAEPLQGERLIAFIQAKQAQLPLGHEGNAWGQGGVVVKLLARAQLQGLQCISQARLSGFWQSRKWCPSPQDPQGQG
jgi:magnesium-transporting ATPase (P-type)